MAIASKKWPIASNEPPERSNAFWVPFCARLATNGVLSTDWWSGTHQKRNILSTWSITSRRWKISIESIKILFWQDVDLMYAYKIEYDFFSSESGDVSWVAVGFFSATFLEFSHFLKVYHRVFSYCYKIIMLRGELFPRAPGAVVEVADAVPAPRGPRKQKERMGVPH